MSEIPEALRLANELVAYHSAPHHKLAAAKLLNQHTEIERLNAVALQAQSAAIDLAYKNGQLRKALVVCLAHWLNEDNPDELQGDVMKFKELCDW